MKLARLGSCVCVGVAVMVGGCASEPKPTGKRNVTPAAEKAIDPAIDAALAQSAADAQTVTDDDGRRLEVVTRSYDIRHLIADVPDFATRRWFDEGVPRWRTVGAGGGASVFEEEADDFQLSRGETLGMIQDMARDTVDPDNWRSVGGLVGSMTEKDGVLYITQTLENHANLELLIEEMARQRFGQVGLTSVTYHLAADELDAALKIIGHASAIDEAKADQLAAHLAKHNPPASRFRTACFNGQRISVVNAALRKEIDFDAAVGTNAALHDIDLGMGLNANRPGAIVDIRPTLRPDADEVILEMRIQITRPEGEANPEKEVRDVHVSKDAIAPIAQTDARLVNQRTVMRIATGGAAVLVSAHGAKGATLTVVRAWRGE